MKNKHVVCPRCHRSFRTAQGRSGHLRFCKVVKDKPLEKPVPAEAKPALPSPVKAVRTASGQWNPTLPEAEKELLILSSMPLGWGIRKSRDRKWVATPMAGTGLDYETAAARADKRNVIDRTRRLLPMPRRRRRTKDDNDGDDGLEDEVLLALLALAATR